MAATKKIGGHETTLVLTPKTTLEELIKSRKDTKKRVDSMNGTHRQKLAAAKENKHLDTWAFGVVARMEDWDDETLHIRYFNLLYYMDQLGVEKRATAQEDLFANGDDDEEEAEDDPKKKKPKAAKANGKGAHADSNVTPIGKAARAVAEAAGDEFKSTH